MIKNLLTDMTPLEVLKEFAPCALAFGLVGVLVFLSTLI